MFDTIEGIQICRQIEKFVSEVGLHCGLTGSVLYKGSSEKDLDVIIYPHQVSNPISKEVAKKALAKIGIKPKYRVSTVASCQDKDVEVFETESGRRIDIFFL